MPGPVDLALILAVDVSSSIDGGDYQLQMKGIADALRDPDVQAAIAAGPFAAIALSVVQWSTRGAQDVTLDWTIIGAGPEAREAAALIEAAPRQWQPGGTGMAAALAYCARHFMTLSVPAARHVVDVSGDGPDNEGGDLAGERKRSLAAGITINGLPIISGSTSIARYYALEVIAGPGCFLVPAQTIMDFGAAMKKKILREVSLIAA